jgi:hypothetical protein
VEEARECGKRARMAFNKAVVDGETYVYDEDQGGILKEREAYPWRNRNGGRGTQADRPGEGVVGSKRPRSLTPEGTKANPERRFCSPVARGGRNGHRGRGGSGSQRGSYQISQFFSPMRGSSSQGVVPQFDGYWSGPERRENGYGYGQRD